MTMTKRDYARVAKVLAFSRPDGIRGLETWGEIVHNLATAFEMDSERFNRKVFMEAVMEPKKKKVKTSGQV